MRLLLLCLLLCLRADVILAQSECDCWQSKFSEKGQSYREAVKALEQSAVDEAYLRDTTPQAYYHLIDSIIFRNEVFTNELKGNIELYKDFEQCFLNVNCDDLASLRIRQFLDRKASYAYVSPMFIFQEMKEFFPDSLFADLRLRHFVLCFMDAQHINSVGFFRLLEPSNKERNFRDARKARNLLMLELNEHDSLFVEGQYTPLEDLEGRLIAHFTDSSMTGPDWFWVKVEGLGPRRISQHIISVQVHPYASYKFYTMVHERINAAYYRQRHELCLREFGMYYYDILGKRTYREEQRIILELLPIKISESILQK